MRLIIKFFWRVSLTVKFIFLKFCVNLIYSFQLRDKSILIFFNSILTFLHTSNCYISKTNCCGIMKFSGKKLPMLHYKTAKFQVASIFCLRFIQGAEIGIHPQKPHFRDAVDYQIFLESFSYRLVYISKVLCQSDVQFSVRRQINFYFF